MAIITVEYIDHFGSDDRIVDAARCSFDKTSDQYTPEQNAKLIKYLAKHNHSTPFNHPQITLRETVPIPIARQRFKHTVGFSYNEISRRYVKDDPSFFTPDAWRMAPEGSIKQGSGDVHPDTTYWSQEYEVLCRSAFNLYRSMIRDGVAPEMARMVLPQSMMTSYYVTGSLSAFARAYGLRKDSHSQKEIQDLAKLWDEIISPLFPIGWDALTNY